MEYRLEDWKGFCDPPELIQRCLSCGKARCDNCLQWGRRKATEEKKEQLAERLRKRFMQELESCGSIIEAAKKLGVTRYFANRWYKREELQKALEWHTIRKMLDSGIPKSRIARTLHISSAWYIMGRHAERYEQYIQNKQRKGSKKWKKR